MCDNYDTEQLGECASCGRNFTLEELDREDLCEDCQEQQEADLRYTHGITEEED